MKVYTYQFTLNTRLSFEHFLNMMLCERAEDVPEGKARWLYALYHLPEKSVVKSIEGIKENNDTLTMTVEFYSAEWGLWFRTMIETSK